MASLLVVDDDPDTAAALTEILRDEGHEVRTAFDGEAGLRRIDEGFPDLVLLDIEMPILGGPGMARSMFLLDLGREDIPIVLVSGAPNLGQVAAEVGTPYYLAKPFGSEALVGLLGRVLEERTPPRPARPPLPAVGR